VAREVAAGEKPRPRRSKTLWSGGFDCRELGGGTQKVRWVFSAVKQPVVLKQISALTRSRWQRVSTVRIEPAGPRSAEKAEIDVYNGVSL